MQLDDIFKEVVRECAKKYVIDVPGTETHMDKVRKLAAQLIEYVKQTHELTPSRTVALDDSYKIVYGDEVNRIDLEVYDFESTCGVVTREGKIVYCKGFDGTQIDSLIGYYKQ